MKFKVSIVLCGIFFIVGVVNANECAKESASEAPKCAVEEFRALDAKLNKDYNNYRLRLDEFKKLKFRDVQLAWIKYRDLACGFESSQVEGGSAFQMIRSQCLSKLTRQRIDELEYLLNCEEGDLSCPAPR
jgi:uncharacterized protein YecT (DUF1311 family)